MLVFLRFQRGVGIWLFRGGAGHGIRLWFALTGVIVDCRFLRPRRAIETIETIETIEMVLPSAGWGCAFWRGSDGG